MKSVQILHSQDQLWNILPKLKTVSKATTAWRSRSEQLVGSKEWMQANRPLFNQNAALLCLLVKSFLLTFTPVSVDGFQHHNHCQ
ncbi:MAG: hypothetical protein AAGG02_15865 [Cyanobacteria bacterium P01_H01_bin.15]